MNSAPVGPARGTQVITVTAETRTEPRDRGEVADGLLLQGWKLVSPKVPREDLVMVHPDRDGVVVYLLEVPRE